MRRLSILFGWCGGVRERSNRAVLKTVDPRGSVGSNPTPTAIYLAFIQVLCYFWLFVFVRGEVLEWPNRADC